MRYQVQVTRGDGTLGWSELYEKGTLVSLLQAGHLRDDHWLLGEDGVPAQVRELTPAPPSPRPPSPAPAPSRLTFGDFLLGAALVTGVGFGLAALGKALAGPRPTASKAERTSIEASAHRQSRKYPLVCADHIGWPCPPPLIGRHKPDLYATDFKHEYIEEHETWKTVGKRHSVEQDREFRRWAARSPNRTYRRVIA